ncbi:MAG: glycosyltransferase family 2 protein [Nitrosomonadaceae bacterium]
MFVKIWKALRQWNRARKIKNRGSINRKFHQRYKLGVMAIMKQEAMNLEEWIQHYLWQGIDQIYLIDNGSTDNSLKLVRPWIDQGVVKLISLEEPWKQKVHYRTAFKNFHIADECQWLMIADLDEFWFCKKEGVNIREALNHYDEFDVIYTNWSMFGSSGHKVHPAGLRTQFLMRQKGLGHHFNTKWICQTIALNDLEDLDVHKIRGACSSRTISDNEMFQINHYMIQSLEYFTKIKMTRDDAGNEAGGETRNINYFNHYDEQCIIKDTLLADMVVDKVSN